MLVFKKISTFFVLVSFLAIALFSFAIMMHEADGSMPGDCPFSVLGGTSFCPQDVLAVIRHHISTYYAFLNISLHSDIAISIIAFLLVACSILVAFISRHVVVPSFVFKEYYHVLHSVSSFGRKVARWLSLLT
ncbi:MAG: hypothetical protein HZA35_01775 [Parcubacteria group bacterium]|nr:hypothetical protein [Parcubacteria group bacterium]